MRHDSIPHLRLALVFWLIVAVVAAAFFGSRALARAGVYDDLADAFSNIRRAIAQVETYPVAHAQDAPAAGPAAAEQARFVDSMAPRSLAEFAGTWSHHGLWITILPSGLADVGWRTYDPGNPAAPDGHATITFTRAQDRTLYGVVSDSSDTRLLPNGPVRLAEYGYGVGVLDSDGWDDIRASYRPFTLCGPRYADPPDWLRQYGPCGA